MAGGHECEARVPSEARTLLERRIAVVSDKERVRRLFGKDGQ